jgi:uncharacterized repeat protein (TIGR01451 family)
VDHARGGDTTTRHGFGLICALTAALAFPATGRADGCIEDAYDNGGASLQYLWPNWTTAHVASFDVLVCYGCGYASEIIRGLTVVNFGTAGAGDFKGVYAELSCPAGKGVVDTGLIPLTYAGFYTEDSGVYPAWTWAGSTPDFNLCDPMCVTCNQVITVNLYVDMAPCPTDQAIVELGFPVNSVANPIWYGSISDNQGCAVPWGDMSSLKQTIEYVLKTGPTTAAPGDTVTYTVTYGRPGTAPLSNIIVTDSLPPYTHYAPGTATPAPDPGWDPDPGPPSRLRWTLPGGAVTGGPTSEMTFGVTVDWGNGEAFEPGSGDVAAPENARLDNRASVNWIGATCVPNQVASAPARTVVRRYLFWMLGDNDVLLAGKIGLPDDEMIYSVFIKNVSASKTWWAVKMWDTVPAELDPWGNGMGFDDPCSGWTMTPSGCAAASPGRVLAGTRTLLTWTLDMPPGMTLELRWKGSVRISASAGSTASNHFSLLELGRSGVANGTGHAGAPREFIHDAQIVLRTTYIAYGAYGYQCTESTNTGGQAFHIHFFPLNKMTNFSLYKQEHCNDAFANAGGVSPTIGDFVGTCSGGFADGGWPGCKTERVPACYWPVAYDNTFPIGGIYPTHILFKVISNAPFVWELMANSEDGSADRWAFSTASSLTFSGRIHYGFMQNTFTGGPPGDEFFVINTSDTLATTELLFRWEPANMAWEFMELGELDPGTVWRVSTALAHNQSSPAYVWNEQSYRLVSSVSYNLVWRELYNGNSQRGIMAPMRETGLLVSKAGTPGTFYTFPFRQGWVGCATNIAVMNVGGVACDYRMYRYDPVGSMYSVNPAGSWTQIFTGTVPAGIANIANPDVYGANYIAGVLPTTFGNPTPHWFIRIDQVTTNAAIQVMMGSDLSGSFSSGGILHDISGQKSGQNFWLSQTAENYGASKNCSGSPVNAIYTVDVFCPATGMVPRMRSYQTGPGYDARYTTTGPDQVVSFRGLTGFTTFTNRNWEITVGGIMQDAVVQFIDAQISEKYYTLPFVSQGTFYTIIAPPIVYSGQSFWLTLIVTTQTGNTKTDYCGTTSFTSTDSSAKIEGAAMDGYNYTWKSNVGAGCGIGPFDNGVRIFMNVTFTRLGLQSIVANDTADGSITGLGTVLVVGVDVKLTKEPRLMVAASGDTVQFRVCWSNYSSASAFTFVVTDAVPAGTTFVPEASSAALSCGNTNGVAVTVGYSTQASGTLPPPASFTNGNPVAGTRWLRWTVQYAGVQTTGCVCFRTAVF